MTDDIQRTLGAHGAKLELLTEGLRNMNGKLDALLAAEAERKGAKRTAWAIAAAAGSAASVLATAAIEAWKR